MRVRTAAAARRGTFIPFLAVTITALLGFVALAIDLGMLTLGRTECQNAADTGALTGARLLNNRTGVTANDKPTSLSTVKDVIPNNDFLTDPFTVPPDANIVYGQYAYDTTNKYFRYAPPGDPLYDSTKSLTAVRVTISQDQPTFFAKIFGVQTLPNGAVATAVHRPRDVAVILDFSASMRFGSMTMWPSVAYENVVARGLMSPDPSYPQFGHYDRYTDYSSNVVPSTTGAGSGVIANRPNPLFMVNTYKWSDGSYTTAPNNLTVETPGGPPVVMDFRFDPSNLADPSVKVTSVTAGNLRNAFHRWFQRTPTDTPDTSLPLVDQTNNFKYTGFRPRVLTAVDNSPGGSLASTAVDRTFDFTGYDPTDTTSTNGPVPAPDSFATQDAWPRGSASPSVPYAGDVYPRKGGVIKTNTSWDPTTATGAAVNAAELLGWTPNSATSWPGTVPNRGGFPTGAGLWGYQPAGTAPSGVTAASMIYDPTWLNFRDATWERYGYDLDLSSAATGYVTNRAKNTSGSTPPWDPRWDWKLATGLATTATTVGWQTGGIGTGWQHNMKTVLGDVPLNRRTVPPDSSSLTGTGATTAQSITYRPKLLVPDTGRVSSFDGYSMGPGYWGKTFFIWPPDPRFGVRDPNTGATTTTGWPDVTSPSATDPAFATKQNVAGVRTPVATPIPMCDWRRRFFLPSGASETNPNPGTATSWFDPQSTTAGVSNIDATLFSTATTSSTSQSGGTAGVLRNGTGYKVNYRAVLAWLKSGPQVLPPNLRAGRIVYYTSIPNDCDSFASDGDQRFWRDYIDFVLGYRGNSVYTPEMALAGVEYNAWPEGTTLYARGVSQFYPADSTNTANAKWDPVTPASTATPAGVPPPTPAKDPDPYTNYSNNPARPRVHFWFGPLSMMDFISCQNPYRLWWPGTCHEAQCWQLKAAVSSALDDIRVNHPNDYCGLTYFANDFFKTPRVPMGQDFTTLKNALFYNGPNTTYPTTDLLSTVGGGNTTTEVAPYDPANISGTFATNRLQGIIPNADGGTDPNTGFATAYNILSPSSTLYNLPSTKGQYGGTGRLGASKIVIFETDGVPNGSQTFSTTGTGSNTYYQNSGTNVAWSSGLYSASDTLRYPRRLADMTTVAGANMDASYTNALGIVYQINQPASATGTSGLSLPNSEARVYPIGFGDLFAGYSVGQLNGADDLTDNSWVNSSTNLTGGRNAIKFLLTVGQVGGTLPMTATNSGGAAGAVKTMPSGQVIVGPYQTRINNLRNTLQTIMQSGVQVTLIE